MYRIIEGRGTGKTSRLMLLVKENNGILVCANPHAMKVKAHAYGLNDLEIISYNDYHNEDYDLDKPCFIDELECYVRFLGGNLNGYTLSTED